MKDWCSEFVENKEFNSNEFKRRIDNYFVFSDATFILQDIGENPSKYENWFEAFYYFEETDVIINGLKEKIKIHIPKIENGTEKKLKYERLRDNISRFLESYRNNTGLNFLSGFVRLALNEYQDSDGKERFESALETIKKTFDIESQNDFLQKLITLGNNLNDEQKMELCQSISKFYPEKLEYIAEYYDLAYLLNDVYSEKLTEFKKFNKRLYEQLAEI